MSELEPLSPDLPEFLAPFLPSESQKQHKKRPFVTLTYAASLDSRIAASPGRQTIISHPQTKTMTHYIRSQHDAILIGVGTFNADDPGLNCRYCPEPGNTHNIRPIILDPKFRSNLTQKSRIVQTTLRGENLAPWFVTDADYDFNSGIFEKESLIKSIGGSVIYIDDLKAAFRYGLGWAEVMEEISNRGIKSLMVEGGGRVINSLLSDPSQVDSVIVTIGPVYLGSQGVEVSPSREVRFKSVKWWSGISDSVMAASI